MPSRRRVLGGSAGLLAALAGCTTGEDLAVTDTTRTTTEPRDSTTTTTAGGSSSGPWRTFRGDAANTGVAAGSGPTTEPSVLWQAANAPRATAMPVTTESGVYAPSSDGTLYALSADGDVRWRASIEGRPWTPAVVGDLVVVPTGEALVAFDRDGEEAWRLPNRGFFQQPAALDGMVVAGSFGRGAVLVDPADGTEVGRVADGWRAFEPVIADGVAFVALSDNRNDAGAVAAIGADGEEVWRAGLDERATSRVGFADGTVYAGTDSGYVYALDAATGDRQWRTSVGDWVTRGPTAGGGRVFAATLKGGFVALDTADGEEAWRVDLGASTDPVAVGDLVLTDDGRDAVVALDAADGAERWRLDTDGRMREGVRVAGGRGVVGAATGTVHAFDPATGEERWRHVTKPRRFPSPVVGTRFAYVGSRGTSTRGYVLEKGKAKWSVNHSGQAPDAPAVVGSTVLSASETGDVNATEAYTYPDEPTALTPTTSDDGTTVHIDPPQEEEVWNVELDAGVRSSVSYDDGTGIVGTDDGLAALHAASGEVAWRAPRGGAVESTPAVTGGAADGDASSEDATGRVVVAGANDGTVAAHALADGAEQWSVETGDRVISSPAVRDATVFVGSDDGSLYALTLADGAEQWRFDTGGPVVSSPAATAETVAVGSADGSVYAIDAATGGERWRFDTDGPVHSSPAIGRDESGGTVYVGSRDRHLYAIDLGDGSERWRFQADNWVDSSPALAYGAVFVADQSGNLYALVG
jgi:outer membrane protein assembly factor BamB